MEDGCAFLERHMLLVLEVEDATRDISTALFQVSEISGVTKMACSAICAVAFMVCAINKHITNRVTYNAMVD